MKLKVLTEVKYLSPSSYGEWLRCQMLFYLKRMAGYAWPEDTQGTAAAVGSAFDSYVKHEIAKRMGLGSDPQYDLTTLLDRTVETVNRDIAIPLGKVLYNQYARSGMLEKLFEQGLSSIELREQKTISSQGKEFPLLGLPDAALADGTMVDWKVQGSVSSSGASPTPGYQYGKRGLSTLPAHKRAGEPLENLNDTWARQLACYSWLFTGMTPFRDIPVAIENVTVRNGKPTFTSIRTTVSEAFQIKLFHQMHEAWELIQAGEIEEAIPSERKCYAYNTECPVADRCEAFKRWRNLDPNDPLDAMSI
jgi:hypothetical protein